MTGGRRVVAGAFIAMTAMTLAVTVLAGRGHLSPPPGAPLPQLYVRSGTVADRLFLSFDALAADVYWMRAIQHYASERRSSRPTARFALLQPLLDLTTTLDPRFNLAYRFGAIFLSMEPPDGPGRPDQAISLLEKGLAANPSRWQYAHDIGFVHYWHTGDDRAAAACFRQAAEMPGAPAWLRPLAAATLVRGGDRTAARQMLQELGKGDEPYVRRAAERALAQLRALDEISALQRLVEDFLVTTGRAPADWEELVGAGLLNSIPADPSGTTYVYSPDTPTVALSPQSSLAPLPQALTRR